MYFIMDLSVCENLWKWCVFGDLHKNAMAGVGRPVTFQTYEISILNLLLSNAILISDTLMRSKNISQLIMLWNLL